MDRKSCRSSQLDDEDGRWCSGAFLGESVALAWPLG